MEHTGFITMICPHCGGKRTIRPDKTTVVCEYCGAEFMVSPDLRKAVQESRLACPQCHRDDRVEKVSSIMQNQIQVIEGQTLQSQAVVTKKGRVETRMVPTTYNATQASALAQKLCPPEEPIMSPLPPAPKVFSVEGYLKGARRKKSPPISSRD